MTQISNEFKCESKLDSKSRLNSQVVISRFSKEIATELHSLRVPQPPSSSRAKISNGLRVSQPLLSNSSPTVDPTDEVLRENSAGPAGAIEPWLQLQVQEQIPPQQLGSVILDQRTITALFTQYGLNRLLMPFLTPVPVSNDTT